MTRAWRWILTAATFALAACSGDSGTAPQNRAVASVVVTASVTEVTEEDQITLVARTLDADGGLLSGRSLTWSSSDESIATVSSTGVLAALKSGPVTITASSEGKSGSVTLTVNPVPVASVELDVANLALTEGVSRQVVTTVKSASGRAITGRFVGWVSSDPSIVSVDAIGKVTAIRVGAARITATVQGKSAEAQVIVSADYPYDLLYSAWSGVAGVAPELYRVNMNQPGAMPARVFPNKPVYEAMASPDGSRIVFVAIYQDRPQVYVVNIDGSDVQRLTSGTAQNDQPVWSPDGSRIAFRRWELSSGGQSDIWVMNADGSDARNLTSDMGVTNQTSPTWSPIIAGKYRIAFSSQTNDPNGEAHLFTMADDGSDKLQITSGAVFDEQPSWSPDGANIAFERYSAFISGDLFLVAPTGGNERRLSPLGLAFGQFGPTWSPDGKMVAFTSKHADERTYQVYTVWADGTRLAQRTFGDESVVRPEFVIRN